MRATVTMRMTLTALAGGESYGSALQEATGMNSGTLYPLLRRLRSEGLVVSRIETHAERGSTQGRPLRVYYSITDQGRLTLRDAGEVHPNPAPERAGRNVPRLRELLAERGFSHLRETRSGYVEISLRALEALLNDTQGE